MTRLAHYVACVLLAFGTLAAAPSTPAPAPTASPTPDPAMLARARDFFTQLQNGKLDRSQLNAQMAAGLTDQQVTAAHTMLTQLGTPVTFEQVDAGVQKGDRYAVYLVAFGNGQKLDFVFAVDPSGKVAGLRMMPAQ